MTLEDERVRLEMLTAKHAGLLAEVASEPKLVQYSPSDIESAEALTNYIDKAIMGFKNKSTIAFAIYDKQSEKYAGSSRYMNIDEKSRVLEIGSTWIGNSFQGTGLNKHMKLLMLNNAFDEMGYEKVEFRIDERNTRSRKAVEKLGAVLEGVLRENVYLLDGYKRNTCCYGILKNEWIISREKNA